MNFPNQMDNDRKEVIRILSQYHRLKLRQLKQCFPSISDSTLHSMLRRLEQQGRLCVREDFAICLPETEAAEGMTEAFDVLLDFFPEVSYHAPGEYPVTLTFFAREEGYDIIWIPEGKELLTIHALSQQPVSADSSQRLIALANIRQLEAVSRFPQTAAFCLVADGTVRYFKKQQGGIHG